MYEAFFGLREKPFALTPNTGFLVQLAPYQACLNLLRVALGEGEHAGNVGKVITTVSETSRLDNTLLKAKFGEALTDCYKTSKTVTVRITRFEAEE